jgi:predicted RNase H-like HicB family nuclease
LSQTSNVPENSDSQPNESGAKEGGGYWRPIRDAIRFCLSSYVLEKNERISFIKKYAQIVCNMKTLIQIHKEGKYFVAIDLITNVTDQGLTESEAISNLKMGLLEYYQVLLELAPKGRKLSFLDIEVEGKPLASGNLG